MSDWKTPYCLLAIGNFSYKLTFHAPAIMKPDWISSAISTSTSPYISPINLGSCPCQKYESVDCSMYVCRSKDNCILSVCIPMCHCVLLFITEWWIVLRLFWIGLLDSWCISSYCPCPMWQLAAYGSDTYHLLVSLGGMRKAAGINPRPYHFIHSGNTWFYIFSKFTVKPHFRTFIPNIEIDLKQYKIY